MGMREEIQAELAEAFDDDLADAVNTFDGLYIIQGEWDPATETGGETQVIYTGRGDSGSADAGRELEADDLKIKARYWWVAGLSTIRC